MKIKLTVLNLVSLLIVIHVFLQLISGYQFGRHGFIHYKDQTSAYFFIIIFEYVLSLIIWFVSIELYSFPDYFSKYNSDSKLSIRQKLIKKISIMDVANIKTYSKIKPIEVISFGLFVILSVSIFLGIMILFLLRYYT